MIPMRKILNILLTVSVLGASLAAGAYIRTFSADTKVVESEVSLGKSEPLLAKPEFFSYNAVLGGRIETGASGLRAFVQGFIDYDIRLMRIQAYISLMNSENTGRGSDALSQGDLIDSGILFLREIVGESDAKTVLDSWTVLENKTVQSFADKYIALANSDGYDGRKDIRDVSFDLYPQWASERALKSDQDIPDLSTVRPLNPSSCKVPQVDRESLKVEYDTFFVALREGKYGESVSLIDDLLVAGDAGDDMNESAYFKQLKSINVVTGALASSYNNMTKAELGYPVMTFDGKHSGGKEYQEVLSIALAIYEAQIHVNSYSSRGVVGSPLDVYSLETNDLKLQTGTLPTYLSEHALLWTITAGYLRHYGLEFDETANKQWLTNPLLAGKGPERFGEGVLYWTAGIDASISLGECLVKHHLTAGA